MFFVCFASNVVTVRKSCVIRPLSTILRSAHFSFSSKTFQLFFIFSSFYYQQFTQRRVENLTFPVNFKWRGRCCLILMTFRDLHFLSALNSCSFQIARREFSHDIYHVLLLSIDNNKNGDFRLKMKHLYVASLEQIR